MQEKVLKKLPEILPIKRSEMTGTLSSTFFTMPLHLLTTLTTRRSSHQGDRPGHGHCKEVRSGQRRKLHLGQLHHASLDRSRRYASVPRMPLIPLLLISLSCSLSDYDAFINDLKNITKGDFSFDVDGQSVMATSEEDSAPKGKGRGGKAGRGGGRGARGRGGK